MSSSTETATAVVPKTHNWKKMYEEQVKINNDLKQELTTQKNICYIQGRDESQGEIKALTEKLALYEGADIEANLAEIKALKEQVEQLSKNKKVKEKEEVKGTLQELLSVKGADWVKKHLTKDQFVECMTEPENILTIVVGGGASVYKPKVATARKELTETEINSYCWARVWNGKTGGRCNRKHIDGSYCKQHAEQVEKKEGLTNGDVRITGKGSIPLNKALERKLYSEATDLVVAEGVDIAVVGKK